MNRYIDADLLKQSIPNTKMDEFENCRYCRLLDEEQVKDLIDAQPTADVRENVKGRWVEYPDCLKYDGAIMQEDFVCPECKAVFSAIDNEGERFNYCPNCGADMRGEV